MITNENTTDSIEKMLSIALTSPALQYKSKRKGKFSYPERFQGKTPLKIKMARFVESDLPPEVVGKQTIALKDGEYYCWVNSYGAVASILPNGQTLGLYPSEFVVTEYHEK
jgi:hypothetical protein